MFLLPSPPRLRLSQKHLQVVPIILNKLNTFLYIIKNNLLEEIENN